MKKLIQRVLLIIIIAAATSLILYLYADGTISEPLYVYVVVCIAVVTVLVFLINRLLNYMGVVRYLKSPLSKIDKMTGEEFEFYLKCRFEKNGYKVETTPASNDYGADLICTNRNGVLVVQAKRYEGTVGTAAVQEVVAAKEYYEADRCMVVTNSYFTKNAISLAEVNEVELIDRDRLTGAYDF